MDRAASLLTAEWIKYAALDSGAPAELVSKVFPGTGLMMNVLLQEKKFGGYGNIG